MRAIFMGTPDFAVPSLVALHERGWKIVAVLCQPDKPAGRGMKLTPPPVKKKAEELGLPVMQPAKLRDEAVVKQLRELEPDVIAVAAYGKILARSVLEIPKIGCINVHASVLPRLRGAAPIHWAVLNGEKTSGVTIMKMDEGMDTGDMLVREEIPLAPDETAGSLHDKLAPMGARLLVQALDGLMAGTVKPVPQDHAQATLAPKLPADLGRVDWTKSAAEVDRQIRGSTPFPGAYTFLGGKRLRVAEARIADGSGTAGSVIAAAPERGIVVACGSGAIALARVQPEGKKPQAVREFLAGHRVAAGERVGEEPGAGTAGSSGGPPEGAR